MLKFHVSSVFPVFYISLSCPHSVSIGSSPLFFLRQIVCIRGEVVHATYVPLVSHPPTHDDGARGLWRSYPALLAALAESPALGAGA